MFQKINGFLYGFSTKTAEILSLVLFGVLAITSFLFSVYYETAEATALQLRVNPHLLYLIILILCLLLLKGLCSFFSKANTKRLSLLLVCSLIYIFLFCFIWTYFTKTIPSADQASIYYLAKDFAAGNYGAIVPDGSYLSCYPHQIGLVSYYELLIRFFNTSSYRVLQCTNILYILLLVYSQYSMIRKLFSKREVSICYLILMDLCLPLFFYTPFLYGEVPSIALLMVGVNLSLFLSCQKERPQKLSPGLFAAIRVMAYLGILVSFTLAVAVRKNSLIFIIAYIIIMLLLSLQKKRLSYLLHGFIICLCTLTILPLIQSHYEGLAGNKLNKGVPPLAYFAMGMQESSAGPGWYNSYNYNTYVNDAQYDVSIAKEIARKDLEKQIATFTAQPLKALSFYYKKLTYEWSNSGFASLYFNHITYEGARNAFWESCFSGRGFRMLTKVMSFYQFSIYLFAFIGAIKLFCTKEKNPWHLLFYVAALGGAMFYLIWEGNGRYVFPYFIFILPYAAAGCSAIISGIKLPRYSKEHPRIPPKDAI